MAYVEKYKDLEVYKLIRELSYELYTISRAFPKEETYSLTNQIRRSSRSIGSQLAEAWGKRRYINHFISKLTDSDSEQFETQHWIEIAEECNYIDKDKAKELIEKCELIGKMLQKMIDKSDSFCKKEPAPDIQL